MPDTDKSIETMVKNIEAKTGKSLAELADVIAKSGLTKHGEIRAMLMERFDLGHGHANSVIHLALKSDGQSAAAAKGLSGDAVLDAIYQGKAELRPLHDLVVAMMGGFGAQEVAPKKGYVSYRRKKQFAMVGPKTKTAIEIGLAAKQLPAHPRLTEMPPNSMCRYTTRVGAADEVDATLERWLRQSYDEAG
jgi:hypothetical protein